MGNVFTIDMNKGECWYGGAVIDCDKMPFDFETDFEFDLSKSNIFDQAASILLSNQGRAICYVPDKTVIKSGRISISYSKEKPTLINAGKTLKDAYRFVSDYYFIKDDVIPPEDCFIYPQFNDWMEMGYNQSQSKILEYADKIVENGYKHSILMIDDKWTDYYGGFTFNKERFPDPIKMIKELHEKGFKVMLWETPFVSPDSPEFRILLGKDCLVKGADGNVALRKWWNGYSAVIDLSNPAAFEWFSEQNQKLLDMGIDGFKFDAGDVDFYRSDDINYGGFTPEQQNRKYCEFGRRYKYHEFRSMLNESGRGCMWRQNDKAHAYGHNGLKGIIGGALIQNLLGYWYSAPDMVGGGSIGSDKIIDEELFVRFAEASALMTMMQWSRLPHNCISGPMADLCKKYADLHCEFGEYIYSLAQQTRVTEEPILRMLEYAFPCQGFERCMDAFMLGDKYLVCPVIKKGEFVKKIALPQGKWKYIDGNIYDGGKEYEFDTPVEVLPYFERIGN